jgi:hypothetical protein
MFQRRFYPEQRNDMRMRKNSFMGFMVFAVACHLLGTVRAQKVTQDTTKQKLESKVVLPDSSTEEIVLDIIYIKGNVEKPGVIVMPKRVEPELEKVELERSFKREVKEGIGDIPKPEKELREVERVESIKKTVKRKRK